MRKSIQQTPNEESAFSIFHESLRFVDVYSRRTREKVFKFEIWEVVKFSRDEQAMIRELRHPDFIFQKREKEK